MVNRLQCAAEQLRDALYVTMAEAGAKPCKIFLSPSPVTPIDVCCDCGDGDGQAWVSLINTRPVGNAQNNFPCAVEIEATFTLGMARCAYTIDDLGNAPSADELNENFERMTADYRIMKDAISLFATEFGLFKNDYRLGDFDVHPIGGGCSAYSQYVYVNLGTC
jgi:hypothetical protein